MKYVNLNGKIVAADAAAMPVDNGAFRYGYGLFETIFVADGAIRLKQYHWDRLFAGIKQLNLELPALITPGWMEEEVLRTVERNKSKKLCRVRLQLFAGGGGLYGPEIRKPGFIIECFPLESDNLQLNQNGLTVGIAAGLNKSIDALSNLKSCNALIYAMAAQQAGNHKWNDALVCNAAGNVIESTIANIFLVKNERIYTPPLSDGCIAGVMRRCIMEKTGQIIEKSLSANDLLAADEVFLTNAIKGIRWVRSLDDSRYNNEQTKQIYHSVFG